MKLLSPSGWFAALRSAWSGARREHQDPADMGTAFGLDSITVVEFEAGAAPTDASASAAAPWQRRLARRSRL